MGNFTKKKFTDEVFTIAKSLGKINSSNDEIIDCKSNKHISKDDIERLFDSMNKFMNDNIEDCCRRDLREIIGRALLSIK